MSQTIFSRVFWALLLLTGILPQFASAALVNVGIQDNVFNPSTISVTQGDTVKWTNNGVMQHTVSADNSSFDSPTLVNGQSFQWTFSSPGTYRYYCALHGGPGGYGMSGTVTVAAPAVGTQPIQTQTTQQTQIQTQTQIPTTSTGNPQVDALRNQVIELLNRITSLQSTVGGSSVSNSSSNISGAVQCPLISRNLKRGMSGDDVTRLQRFLALDRAVYPEAQVTGYYGALTEAAVKRFQCNNKLVCEGTAESTGYGVTGPRTAALLALQCPNVGGNVGGFLKVSPLSGPAPLVVAIEATTNATRSCSSATYEVDYGDNTAKTQIVVPANHCNELRQVLNHTYSAGGTYVITLRSGVYSVSSTVTVSGTGQSSGGNDTFSATPTSGAAPFVVTFKGIVNALNTCSPSSYTLTYGDGQSTSLAPSGCTANAYTVTHQYTSAGTFTAKLTRGSYDIGTVTITVTGGVAQTDTITASPNSGTAPLNVTFTGVVNAAGACNAGPYTLVFGDAQSQAISVSGCNPSGYTVNHAYATGGTFNARLDRGTPAASVGSVTITVTGGTSAGYGSYFAVSPGAGGDIFAVAADFELASSCTAYQLNWGDGTVPVSQTQGSCSGGVVSKQLTHQYTDSGSYTVTLKRGPNLSETHTAGITLSE